MINGDGRGGEGVNGRSSGEGNRGVNGEGNEGGDDAMVTTHDDKIRNQLNHSDGKLFLERRLAWVVGYDAMTVATAAAGAITHPLELL